MALGQKMKQVLKENNLKQSDFAESIEENLGQLNMVLNEKRTVSLEMLMKFIKSFPEVDLNWLFDESESDEINILQEPPIQYKKNVIAEKTIKKIEDHLNNLKQQLTQ